MEIGWIGERGIRIVRHAFRGSSFVNMRSRFRQPSCDCAVRRMEFQWSRGGGGGEALGGGDERREGEERTRSLCGRREVVRFWRLGPYLLRKLG